MNLTHINKIRTGSIRGFGVGDHPRSVFCLLWSSIHCHSVGFLHNSPTHSVSPIGVLLHYTHSSLGADVLSHFDTAAKACRPASDKVVFFLSPMISTNSGTCDLNIGAPSLAINRSRSRATAVTISPLGPVCFFCSVAMRGGMDE